MYANLEMISANSQIMSRILMEIMTGTTDLNDLTDASNINMDSSFLEGVAGSYLLVDDISEYNKVFKKLDSRGEPIYLHIYTISTNVYLSIYREYDGTPLEYFGSTAPTYNRYTIMNAATNGNYHFADTEELFACFQETRGGVIISQYEETDSNAGRCNWAASGYSGADDDHILLNYAASGNAYGDWTLPYVQGSANSIRGFSSTRIWDARFSFTDGKSEILDRYEEDGRRIINEDVLLEWSVFNKVTSGVTGGSLTKASGIMLFRTNKIYDFNNKVQSIIHEGVEYALWSTAHSGWGWYAAIPIGPADTSELDINYIYDKDYINEIGVKLETSNHLSSSQYQGYSPGRAFVDDSLYWYTYPNVNNQWISADISDTDVIRSVHIKGNNIGPKNCIVQFTTDGTNWSNSDTIYVEYHTDLQVFNLANPISNAVGVRLFIVDAHSHYLPSRLQVVYLAFYGDTMHTLGLPLNTNAIEDIEIPSIQRDDWSVELFLNSDTIVCGSNATTSLGYVLSDITGSFRLGMYRDGKNSADGSIMWEYSKYYKREDVVGFIGDFVLKYVKTGNNLDYYEDGVLKDSFPCFARLPNKLQLRKYYSNAQAGLYLDRIIVKALG